MAKRSKPKLITLKELRALCAKAGVEMVKGLIYDWHFFHDEVCIFAFDTGAPPIHRLRVKAFCLGLIAMKKDGEL